MDSAAIREFLMTRRARVRPVEVGIADSGRRRVAGLRREEVAMLAGVSVEYYVQIERGKVKGVSDDMLRAIARTLLLDDTETAHLFDLFRAATVPGRARLTIPQPRVPSGIRLLIDAMPGVPAIVQTHRLDAVAANTLGRALFAPVFEDPAPNLARFVFLDERAADLYADWTDAADTAAAMLRVAAGRHPEDRLLSGLVGELSTRSPEFARRWARHDVRLHQRGVKRLDHPLVGSLELMYEGLGIATADDLTIGTYVAEPGTPSRERLDLLTAWVAAPATG